MNYTMSIRGAPEGTRERLEETLQGLVQAGQLKADWYKWLSDTVLQVYIEVTTDRARMDNAIAVRKALAANPWHGELREMSKAPKGPNGPLYETPEELSSRSAGHARFHATLEARRQMLIRIRMDEARFPNKKKKKSKFEEELVMPAELAEALMGWVEPGSTHERPHGYPLAPPPETEISVEIPGEPSPLPFTTKRDKNEGVTFHPTVEKIPNYAERFKDHKSPLFSLAESRARGTNVGETESAKRLLAKRKAEKEEKKKMDKEKRSKIKIDPNPPTTDSAASVVEGKPAQRFAPPVDFAVQPAEPLKPVFGTKQIKTGKKKLDKKGLRVSKHAASEAPDLGPVESEVPLPVTAQDPTLPEVSASAAVPDATALVPAVPTAPVGPSAHFEPPSLDQTLRTRLRRFVRGRAKPWRFDLRPPKDGIFQVSVLRCGARWAAVVQVNLEQLILGTDLPFLDAGIRIEAYLGVHAPEPSDVFPKVLAPRPAAPAVKAPAPAPALVGPTARLRALAQDPAFLEKHATRIARQEQRAGRFGVRPVEVKPGKPAKAPKAPKAPKAAAKPSESSAS